MTKTMILGIVAVLVVGCGGKETSETTADGSLGDVADASGDARDDWIIPQDRPDPVDTYVPIVDGGRDCGLPEAGVGRDTCCNGAPCRGDCIEVSAGKAECQCYGIKGGCTGDFVCCTYYPEGCTKELFCGPGH